MTKFILKVKITQSCQTLCDPMDYRVHGNLQARILEWVAFSFPRRSSQTRDWTQVSCIAGRFLSHILNKHIFLLLVTKMFLVLVLCIFRDWTSLIAQSMGSLGVGHDWATSLSLFTFMHWRRKWQPTPVFLPGECQRQRSLTGYSPWGCKSRTWLSD